MADPSIKVVLIGNNRVGRTSLLVTYIEGKFPSAVPYAVERRRVKSHVDGRVVTVWFWDPQGGERYFTVFPTHCRGTNAFLLCFDVGNRSSFENVQRVFIPEIRYFCPDVPITLVGCKADLRECSLSTCVPREEIQRKSKEWKVAAYFETSAMFNIGLFVAVKQCIRLGLHHCVQSQKYPRPRPCLRDRLRMATPQPPMMPLEEPLPVIQIDPSTFADDWLAAFKDQRNTDVLFVLGSGTEIRAHKIVLCAASSFFADVLKQWSACTKHLGISSILESSEDEYLSHLIIALDSSIEDQTFKYGLQFIYTGLPGMLGDEEREEITKLVSLSRLWKLALLESICDNINKRETYLNPSISVLHNSAMGEKLRDNFLLTELWTDIIFIVGGHEVRAHRIILCTRCRVFSAMLNTECFREGTLGTSITIPNTTRETFMGLLEYLYSDHAPIEGGDPVGVLVLANQFFQPRLVAMAEYCITNGIRNTVAEKYAETVDVVNIMNNSKDHNAKQLPKWCLHFIAKNYGLFKSRQEFSRLTGDDLLFVEEHQWPPISYLQDLAQYEAQQKKCVVM